MSISNSIKGRKWLYWWFLVLDFSIEWIKYKFGVFDEFGNAAWKLYPKFYKRQNEILVSGCANEKIKLNSTNDEDCFQMQNCEVDNGQEMISSSLLYSRDKVHFPKVIIMKFFSTMRLDVHSGWKFTQNGRIFIFFSRKKSSKKSYYSVARKLKWCENETILRGFFNTVMSFLCHCMRSMPRFSYSNCFEIRWNLELFKKA